MKSQYNDVKKSLLRDVQMLTGIVTEDLDYLVFLLLKDGSYFQEKERIIQSMCEREQVEDLEQWFQSIKE